MKLLFDPPQCIKETGEQIYYCVPFDRDEKGGFVKNCFAAVTEKMLYIVENERISKCFELSKCEDILCTPGIGGGELSVKYNGEYVRAALFSSKHLSRFASVSAGAKLLSRGIKEKVKNNELEKTCLKCGRGLPGTKNCPHCGKSAQSSKRKIIKLFAENKKPLALISLFMALGSAFGVAQPWIQKYFIDNALKDKTGTLADVALFVFLTLMATVLTTLMNILKNLSCAKLATTVSADFREKLYHKIQILSLSFIDERRPGVIMNRIMHDTNMIKNFMQDAFGNMFSVLVTMVFAAGVMLITDPLLTLAAVALVPVVFAISFLWHKNVHRRFHMQWKKNDKANSVLQDVISGMRVVKSFGKEKYESERINNINLEYAAVQKKNEVFWATFYPWLTFVMGLGVYLVTYFGGIRVLDGRLTVGTITQFVSYAGLLYGPLGWMTNLPRMLARTATAFERIYDILDEEPSIVQPKDAVEIDIKGKVEFKNVTFGYHSYDPVLREINLSVKPGEMIGLVGASGTGKSTLINLLMHLYEADDGEILIDGINIKNIKSECFHRQIGVVLQETFLFSGTILNNIRFARPDATYEEIIMAAKMANAHDFICKTPDGYNTYVGEHGYNLSGGERQRIAIARAILNNPRLLILDEATSNLDTESEYLIQQALSRLTSGRTTFAIAHRLSTLKDADRLVVIDGHSIAEIGTHNELMEKKGIYYSLVTAQLEMQTLKDIEAV